MTGRLLRRLRRLAKHPRRRRKAARRAVRAVADRLGKLSHSVPVDQRLSNLPKECRKHHQVGQDGVVGVLEPPIYSIGNLSN